jgi:hypothetical protein
VGFSGRQNDSPEEADYGWVRLKDVAELFSETFVNKLVGAGATTGLGAFVAQQVTETRGTAHYFAGTCELEPLGDRLFRFLHDGKQ